MTQVTLGRTGLKTGKNAFGALPIQRVSRDYAALLLRKAYDAGFTFFDTAHSYSDSEEKIGYALSDIRSHILLATKTPSTTVEGFWKDLEQSLSQMKTDYIDLYQFHNPKFCPKPGDGTGLYEAMLKAKAQGKIRFIGLTNHRLDVAEEAVRSGLYDALQFPFCYLATEKDIALVNLCREQNVGFISMKGLSGGLITNSAAAYAWQAKFDNTLPIWGIQRESELDEFIRYIDSPPVLDEALQAVIDKDRQELIGNFCRSCGYCMPCPAGILIPQCARMSQLIRRSPSANWLTEAMQAEMMKVENCLHCGQCSKKCPYELDTPTLLSQNLADYKDILSGQVTVSVPSPPPKTEAGFFPYIHYYKWGKFLRYSLKSSSCAVAMMLASAPARASLSSGKSPWNWKALDAPSAANRVGIVRRSSRVRVSRYFSISVSSCHLPSWISR